MKQKFSFHKLKSLLPFKRFLKDQSAVAMVEFAMMVPVLLVMTVGGFEVARYALLLQKLDRITATFSDLIAREENLSAAELDNLFNSTNHLASPFDFDTNGMIVVTSVVGRDGAAPLVIAQRTKGNLVGASSEIGGEGDDATLPAVFTDADGNTLEQDEGVIIAEIFYDFEPYMASGSSLMTIEMFEDLQIYRKAFFRPRLTAFTTFD